MDWRACWESGLPTTPAAACRISIGTAEPGGYFPTYALGALAAAQLFETALAARPGIPDALSRGDFSPLLGWLRETVHRKGSMPETTDDLLQEATGAPLGTDSFKRHLKTRYLSGR